MGHRRRPTGNSSADLDLLDGSSRSAAAKNKNDNPGRAALFPWENKKPPPIVGDASAVSTTGIADKVLPTGWQPDRGGPLPNRAPIAFGNDDDDGLDTMVI